ncbi:unnamed protein product [Rhizophagus irregularis]|nr:unnamed protein product [Rhizophagus irregularis]
MNGKTVEIEVESSDTIDQLKDKIYKEECIPCCDLVVGKELLSMYEDNIWLGVDEEKQSITRSVQNEWLVSYHGTARNNCKSIAEDEYRLCKGKRFAFGH